MAISTIVRLTTIALVFIFMPGCSSISTVASVANIAMEASGLKAPKVPELPDAQKPARTVSVKLHAAKILNTDDEGKSLALVMRIFKLRQTAAFQQASYDSFLNPEKEKEAFGGDIVEVKEVTLVPGRKFEIEEKVSREAYFIGVVALFRKPAQKHWRIAFAADEAEKSGIIIGAHACALTVGIGKITADSSFSNSLLSPELCTQQ
ncbi:MAG: type VI secretion system lipoprotein TssJ [Burkholderiales bacterium]|nr:type VI secretion system lipoprotein TssJ [Burkholderiales bacterium]